MIDVINLLYDILKSTDLIDIHHKSLTGLWKFAQFATFDSDFTPFFTKNNKMTPEIIVGKIDMIVGIIIANAVLRS